jgi:hypothetical protein
MEEELKELITQKDGMEKELQGLATQIALVD